MLPLVLLPVPLLLPRFFLMLLAAIHAAAAVTTVHAVDTGITVTTVSSAHAVKMLILLRCLVGSNKNGGGSYDSHDFLSSFFFHRFVLFPTNLLSLSGGPEVPKK